MDSLITEKLGKTHTNLIKQCHTSRAQVFMILGNENLTVRRLRVCRADQLTFDHI